MSAAPRLPAPLPPIHRSSMGSQSWAGHPLWRPVRRMLKGRAPRSWERAPKDRHFMLRRVMLLLLVILGAVIGGVAYRWLGKEEPA